MILSEEQEKKFEREKTRDLLLHVIGFLSALKLFLSAQFNIQIPDETINFIIEILSLGIALYWGYKNTYVLSSKAERQKKLLMSRKLD